MLTFKEKRKKKKVIPNHEDRYKTNKTNKNKKKKKTTHNSHYLYPITTSIGNKQTYDTHTGKQNFFRLSHDIKPPQPKKTTYTSPHKK